MATRMVRENGPRAMTGHGLDMASSLSHFAQESRRQFPARAIRAPSGRTVLGACQAALVEKLLSQRPPSAVRHVHAGVAPEPLAKFSFDQGSGARRCSPRPARSAQPTPKPLPPTLLDAASAAATTSDEARGGERVIPDSSGLFASSAAAPTGAHRLPQSDQLLAVTQGPYTTATSSCARGCVVRRCWLHGILRVRH